MSQRKSISKKLRFEVFKRDSFTCQYCGNKAPDVVLEVDHIEPVSKGGKNELLNLVTSCFDCNRGKGDKKLSDNSVIEKQHEELEKLNERKMQIDMMLQWKKSLLNQDQYIVEKISDYWNEVTSTSLTESGKLKAKSILKSFTFNEILEGIDESYKTYNDPEKAWEKLSGVIRTMKKYKDKPYLKDLFYCKAILKNRGIYYSETYIMKYLEDFLNVMDIDELKDLCKKVKNWTKLKEIYFEMCGE